MELLHEKLDKQNELIAELNSKFTVIKKRSNFYFYGICCLLNNGF